MTKADKIFMLGVLLVGITAYLIKGSLLWGAVQPAHMQAVVKVGGEVIQTVQLSPEETPLRFSVQGKQGLAVVEVSGEKIRMLEADCPDQICVKRGWISSAGESIICVPNEIVIYIDAPTAVDAVTY